jgi:hypothetical protein
MDPNSFSQAELRRQKDLLRLSGQHGGGPVRHQIVLVELQPELDQIAPAPVHRDRTVGYRVATLMGRVHMRFGADSAIRRLTACNTHSASDLTAALLSCVNSKTLFAEERLYSIALGSALRFGWQASTDFCEVQSLLLRSLAPVGVAEAVESHKTHTLLPPLPKC